jgi:hypothetical protein
VEHEIAKLKKKWILRNWVVEWKNELINKCFFVLKSDFYFF